MTGTYNKINAPHVDPAELWRMNGEDFNNWREKYDYPRIVNYFKAKSLDFENWMKDQDLSDDILIKYSPSTFLRDQPYLYIYTVLDNERKEKELVSETRYSINETFSNNNLVIKRKEVIVYPVWYQHKTKNVSPGISVNMKQGRSHLILSELELLDIGNCHLKDMFLLGDRHLDFINISDLRITNCFFNTIVKLWFCSAVNLSIEGDLAFIDAYNSQFYEVFNQKNRNLKLTNGNFQSWVFRNCGLNLSASNSILHLWEFSGWDFNATISNTDIREYKFNNSEIRYPIDLGRVNRFHSHIKRLYSQIGKKKEASQHYYLEKTFERKSFLHLKVNYSNEYIRHKNLGTILNMKILYLFKYLYSCIQNILWGYGERPVRIFGISLLTIFIFTLIYYYSPNASLDTRNDFLNSLYYSMVTFTTVGYGDIIQPRGLLRILSGFEALFGLTFWGILIAGFTSKAKDH